LKVIKDWLKANRSLYLFCRETMMRVRRWRNGWAGVPLTSWVVGRQHFISRDFRMGDYGFIGRDCTIYPNVVAGRFLLMAPEVAILGGDHAFRKVGVPMCFSGREQIPPTRIGDDVWIGMSAKIRAGVTIGDGAIIACGAVVTRDVPPFGIVAGVPAALIRLRFDSDDERDQHLLRLNDIKNYGELVAGLN
jgi:acetyltransferase-like isoleucine patch superfamily enzyme